MIKPFSYFKPKTLDEAHQALKTENSMPLAGGTDLLPNLRNGNKKVDLIVDIKGLDELNIFSVDRDKGIHIGAAVPLNIIVDNRELRDLYPVLIEAAFSIATHQLRNRATLAGNICNASPAADMAPPLYILGAEVIVVGSKGIRAVPICEFITGVKKTVLSKDELVVRVEIPAMHETKSPKNIKSAFLKKKRIKGHDLASINIAGLADTSAGILKVCIGACAQTPVLLEGTDQLYKKTGDIEKLGQAVADIAVKSISPIDDLRASAEYRRDMAAVFAKRLIRKICS